ncbi:hypothetical protein SCHAM137S_01961 [Streptomyces chartreusis]
MAMPGYLTTQWGCLLDENHEASILGKRGKGRIESGSGNGKRFAPVVRP